VQECSHRQEEKNPSTQAAQEVFTGAWVGIGTALSAFGPHIREGTALVPKPSMATPPRVGPGIAKRLNLNLNQLTHVSRNGKIDPTEEHIPAGTSARRSGVAGRKRLSGRWIAIFLNRESDI